LFVEGIGHMTNRFVITDGPSKWDLMVSLFEGNKTPRTRVRFTVENYPSPGGLLITAEIDVGIVAIQQEDGSGESWNFQGCTNHTYTNKQVGVIRGYYSTRCRRGSYEFMSQT
jgi:hypothetical protein